MEYASFITDVLAFIDTSKYALLFFACFFEGTLAMMAGGLLWSLGGIAFLPMYLTLLAADIAADTCWYLVGRFGTRAFIEKWGHLFGVQHSSLERVARRFKLHDIKIIILSKLTMGFGLAIPTLVTAGALRIRYLRFLAINTIGALAWVLAMVMVGAYVGEIFKPLAPWQQIVLGAAALGAVIWGLRLLQKSVNESAW
jgi:membrane protein DedA with SNARE-associated domain